MAVRQIPVRELNQHTAEVLARVQLGERVQITRNGTPIAIIEPAEPDPLGGLIESGELRPAQTRLPLPSASEVAADDTAGVDAIVEDRYGQDLW
jgi:prevent-host-death family protein